MKAAGFVWEDFVPVGHDETEEPPQIHKFGKDMQSSDGA